jgi:hypothetical protein
VVNAVDNKRSVLEDYANSSAYGNKENIKVRHGNIVPPRPLKKKKKNADRFDAGKKPRTAGAGRNNKNPSGDFSSDSEGGPVPNTDGSHLKPVVNITPLGQRHSFINAQSSRHRDGLEDDTQTSTDFSHSDKLTTPCMADQPPTSSQHTTGKTTEKQSTTMHIPFRNNEAEIFEVTPTTGRKVTVNPARESLAVHSLLSSYLDEPFEEDEMEDVEGMTPGM